MTHVRTLERHRQLGFVAHGMANGSKLGPTIKVHYLDDEGVSLPMSTGIAEPRRRPVLSMRHPFGVDHLKHRALLEQKRDVLVVLNELHWMRREGTNPPEGHATSCVVAILRRVIIVPLRLSPGRQRQRVGFAAVAGPVCIREGSSQV